TRKPCFIANPPRWSEEIGRVDAARSQESAELAQARGLDLADTLAGQAQALADRLELLGRIPFEPETPPEHGALVGGEVVEHRDQIGSLTEQRDQRIAWVGRLVGDQVAHAALPFTDRGLERHRLQ